MIAAALTGNIGSGKSTVVKILNENGIKTINSDEIAHSVLEMEEIKKKLKEVFGDILTEEGKVDRKKLGKIVFQNREKLNLLNSIVHPEVLKKIYEELNKLSKREKIVVVEIPLLFETGLDKFFKPIIFICTPLKTQIERLEKRDKLPYEEILKRIKAQGKIEEKIKNSHYIIENNSTISELKRKVKEIIKEIERDSQRWESLSNWKELEKIL